MLARCFFVVITIPDDHEARLDRIERAALSVFELRANVRVTPLELVVRDEKRGRRLLKPLCFFVPAASLEDDLALARTIETGIQGALSGGGIASSEVSVWVAQDTEKKDVA